jgi:hypothetical protein
MKKKDSRAVSIAAGMKATEQIIALKRSLDRLQRSLQFFKGTRRQISKWLRVDVCATGGTLELVAIEPRERLRKLLATAEAFSRNVDFSTGASRVGMYLPHRIIFVHKPKRRLKSSSPSSTLAS